MVDSCYFGTGFKGIHDAVSFERKRNEIKAL